MKSILVLASLALASGLLVDPARAATPAETAASNQARHVCARCHGPEGLASAPNFPNLAAQQDDYLKAELRSFRDRHREQPAGAVYMWGITGPLTDAQIDGLADHFAALPPARPASAPDAALAATGSKLFTDGAPDRGVPACASCHGDRAEGRGVFPRLAGQHSAYVVRQLKVLNRTPDGRPQGQVMSAVAHLLTPADMDAVAAYLASM